LLKKSLLLAIFAGIISIVRVKNTTFTPHGFTQFNMCSLEQRGFCMATNNDYSRSSFLMEQYQLEMDVIAAALQEESQDEREERLSLAESSWPLSCACFQAELEVAEIPAYASVAFARP